MGSKSRFVDTGPAPVSPSPHPTSDITQRTSLRAERRACTPLFHRTSLFHPSSGSAFPIKNGSVFQIGIKVPEKGVITGGAVPTDVSTWADFDGEIPEGAPGSARAIVYNV